jgi:hypothetical protein
VNAINDVRGTLAEWLARMAFPSADEQYERRRFDVAMREGRALSSQVVSYQVDESTTVEIEIEPPDSFRPAGSDQVLGWVKDAVAPAVEAAKAVLDRVKETRPDQVELKFGVKVSGETNWLVAKTAGEGNFEVTLTWSRQAADAGASRR